MQDTQLVDYWWTDTPRWPASAAAVHSDAGFMRHRFWSTEELPKNHRRYRVFLQIIAMTIDFCKNCVYVLSCCLTRRSGLCGKRFLAVANPLFMGSNPIAACHLK